MSLNVSFAATVDASPMGPCVLDTLICALYHGIVDLVRFALQIANGMRKPKGVKLSNTEEIKDRARR